MSSRVPQSGTTTSNSYPMKAFELLKVMELGLALGSFGLVAQTWGAERAPALGKLSQILNLSVDEAGKGLTVKARGTVTFCDRDRGMLFVQDGGAAVAVRIPTVRDSNTEFEPQQGQIIELEGITVKGRLTAVIRSSVQRFIEQGTMPAPIELSPGALFQPKAESHWIHVTGWIPSITRLGTRVSSELVVCPGQSLELVLNGSDTSEAKELAGSLVDVFGVFSLKFDAAGKVNGARLYVSDLSRIQKRRSLAVTPIVEAGTMPGKGVLNEPFRIHGSVVNHSLGDFLIVRDSSGSLRVPYRSLNYFSPGSLVEVFAYPLQYRPALLLTNVTVKLVLTDAPGAEAAVAIITPSGPNTNLPVLTRVAQIRRLSPQEASRGYPVHLSGCITYCDVPGYQHFIQDDTAGIYFDAARIENATRLRSGQRVEVEGFTGPGDYAPILLGQSARVLGEEALPTPEMVSFRKLMSGNFDSQWVLLKGVVRNQWLGTNSSTLALFTGDGLIKVAVSGQAESLGLRSLVDAAVEVQGVCRTIFDDHRRLQGVELEVPGWEQVSFKEGATADPFTLPVKPVNELFQFHAEGTELHRAHLVGVVTLRASDGSFYLQDDSGGIQIQPGPAGSSLDIGTTVEVVGFPVILEQIGMVQDALVHPLKKGTTVEPTDLKADAPLEDTLQATLVRLQGEVLGRFPHGSEELLTLRFGQRLIDVLLQTGTREGELADIAPGTIVRLMGVYVAQFDGGGSVQSFRVLLRSANDVTVVFRPAWWNVRRTLWALGGSAAVLLLALGWVRALRRQVHQRTRELHEEIEHHKRTEAKLEAEIAERKRMESEVERTHQELLIASRQAGMAEVATSVLHNVGNVLNSVNVSTSLVAEKIRRSKAGNLSRAAEMIDAHPSDLAHFLTEDPKGRQLPLYFRNLAKHLHAEQGSILTELESLRKNVEHIKASWSCNRIMPRSSAPPSRSSPTNSSRTRSECTAGRWCATKYV